MAAVDDVEAVAAGVAAQGPPGPQPAAGLDPRDYLDAHLRYLLTEKGVSVPFMDNLGRAGFVTTSYFALMADTRATLRQVLADSFNLDPTTRVEARLEQAKICDAWETAVTRADMQRRYAAENRAARLPLQVPQSKLVSMRRRYEEIHGELEDKEVPALPLVESVLEMTEEMSLAALPFAKVISMEQHSDSSFGCTVDPRGRRSPACPV
jgi:hypothetical protein